VGRLWLGITCVNQEEYDRDGPKLAKIGAAVRWLSLEPLLGPINLRDLWPLKPDWVVVGGESGINARPMNPDWVRSLRDQCAELGIPFHFKQWGGIRPKTTGHLLDGVEHRAFPKTTLAAGTENGR
jgi:protein gp37